MNSFFNSFLNLPHLKVEFIKKFCGFFPNNKIATLINLLFFIKPNLTKKILSFSL
jgi:hypothetical protein